MKALHPKPARRGAPAGSAALLEAAGRAAAALTPAAAPIGATPPARRAARDGSSVAQGAEGGDGGEASRHGPPPAGWAALWDGFRLIASSSYLRLIALFLVGA